MFEVWGTSEPLPPPVGYPEAMRRRTLLAVIALLLVIALMGTLGVLTLSSTLNAG